MQPRFFSLPPQAFRLLVILPLFFTSSLSAQNQSATLVQSSSRDTASYPYWIRMMQDPRANYFATVRAFETYWHDRPVTRGCGWKVFKRWQYIMRDRVGPDGSIQDPGELIRSYESFMQNQRSEAGNWVSLGPETIPAPGPAGYEGLGRINAIAFHPTDPNTLYAGSPSGGFWLSHDHGDTWTTTTDGLPTIGVSAILTDPADPLHILIGTGDRDHGDAPGLGVYLSTDGGMTWTPSRAGMEYVTVGELIRDPGNALVILAATTGGIFRSADGGETWVQTQSGSFPDIKFHPSDPQIVYATADGDFYRSADNGQTFTTITSGLTSGQRGAIAVTPAAPGYVYFLQSNYSSGFQGLYRSTDNGLTFSTRSTSPNILDWSCDGSGTGGQGWYDLALTADPDQASTLFAGGINVWKSTDGGSTWQIISHWYGGCGVPAAHADCHWLGYSPVNGKLYAGNDGGVYVSEDDGDTWTDRSVGMTIGQIYKIGQSQTVAGKIINGFQDNGTYTLLPEGWVATGGGDGMECAVDGDDAAYTYFTLYFGAVFRTYNNTGEQQIAGEGVFGIDESGDWVTPFVLSEDDQKRMFIGYKNVWRCSDVRSTTPVWTKISGDETQNCYVLEQSPANTGILYAVRSNSLQRTDNALDATPSWSACSLPGGATPTDLEAHPTDPDIVYATANRKVYKSTDLGMNWEELPGNLPDVPVNCIVYEKNTDEGLYIGTQTGVLFKNATMSTWTPFNENLPVVDVRELEIYYAPDPANSHIAAATYGRGLWQTDLYPSSSVVAAFSFTPATPCQDETVTFTDLTSNTPTSWLWEFSPAQVSFTNGTSATSQNPHVQFGDNTPYTVTLTASNSSGSDTSRQTVQAGGMALPVEEDFPDGTIPDGWQVLNPDGGITWAVRTVSGNGSLFGAWLNAYDYNSPGQTDDLITPVLDLTQALHPRLKFLVAYRRYDAAYFERLQVYVSTDCGSSWEEPPVYDKAGDQLATGSDDAYGFYPGSISDWRCDSVDLSAFAGERIQIRFRSVNGYGNNLFLDQIGILEPTEIYLQNETVSSGQTVCYDASQRLSAAGNGTFFIVEAGGSVTLVAGEQIRLLPGVLVAEGGYLDAYITTSGQFCSLLYPESIPAARESLPETPLLSEQAGWLLYPNPASEKVFIEMPVYMITHSGGQADGRTSGQADGRTGGRADGRTGAYGLYSTTIYHQWDQVRLEVFDLFGRLMYGEEIPQQEKRVEINVASWPQGMYVARLVFMNDMVGSVKFVVR